MFQEPNMDFHKQDLLEKVDQIFKDHFHQAKLIVSNLIQSTDSTWQPGGTAIVVTGKWTTAILERYQDPMGRFTSITLNISKAPSLTIYSVYNCCKNEIAKAGTNTAYAQQWKALWLQGKENADVQREMVEALNKQVQINKKKKHHILIMGDMNEELGKDPNLMSKVCVQNNMFDVHTARLQQEAEIPTYNRGQNRIDYSLLSLELINKVKACGFNLFNEYFVSDHRAQFVDIAVKAPLEKIVQHEL